MLPGGYARPDSVQGLLRPVCLCVLPSDVYPTYRLKVWKATSHYGRNPDFLCDLFHISDSVLDLASVSAPVAFSVKIMAFNTPSLNFFSFLICHETLEFMFISEIYVL